VVTNHCGRDEDLYRLPYMKTTFGFVLECREFFFYPLNGFLLVSKAFSKGL